MLSHAAMPEWLRRRAELTPTRTALIDGRERWTFAQLHAAAEACARALAARGVAKGHHVGLAAGNTGAFVIAVHAIAKLEAVVVPINLRLAPGEIQWQLKRADVGLLLYDADRAPLAFGVQSSGLTCIELESELEVAAPLEPRPLADHTDLNRVQSIVFTSGTTGKPKGAMLTFGNHWWSAVASAINLGLRDGDAWLAALPLFHVGGLAIVMRSLIYGIPALLHRRFDPKAVNQAIDRGEATLISVVSAMLQRMLDEREDRPYPRTLRAVLVGGGPLPEPLLARAERAGLPVLQTYGLTETASQVTTLSPADARSKPGSAGKPLFPTEVKIAGPDASGAGEILVRGPTVTPGYYKEPTATSEALRSGWFHTGDFGYFDPDGFLYVVGRRADLIISGGENIYPAEVEAALHGHPDVAEAGVVGVKDATWGEIPAAMIVLRPGACLCADELAAYCRARLAAYKVPKRYRFVDSLPRNAAGKLLRRQMKEEWERG